QPAARALRVRTLRPRVAGERRQSTHLRQESQGSGNARDEAAARKDARGLRGRQRRAGERRRRPSGSRGACRLLSVRGDRRARGARRGVAARVGRCPDWTVGSVRAILTYHSIDDSGSVISISPSQFVEHLRWLASSSVDVVAVSRLLSTTSDRNAVAITFDDAFENFATHAWPLLREHGLP